MQKELDKIKEACMHCERCELHKTRTNIVFDDGVANHKLMLIGEAPGFWEDKKGKPFVGKAGQLLDKIFEGLPESYKIKYLREFLDGKKIQEIAQELEVSRSAVHQGVKKGMAVLREIMDKPDTSRGNVLASILILSEAFEKIPRKAKKIFAEEVENFLASRSGTEKYTIENFDKNEKIKNHNFFNKNEILVKTAQRLKKLL